MGGIGSFDVTSAAASHSALAGVLAGIVVVLITIVSDQEAVRGSSEWAHLRFSIRLLVSAMFLLVISAVVWGGESGSPSRSEVEHLADGKTSLIADELSGDFAIGAVGTVLLSLGAMCLAVGVLNYVNRSNRFDLGTFVSVTVSLLGALAIYEICFFTVGAAALLWAPTWSHVNLVSMLLAILATISLAASWMISRVRPTADSKVSSPRSSTLAFLYSSGTLAAIAYAATPVPSATQEEMSATAGDHLAVVALCASALLAIAFVNFLIYDMSAQMPSEADLDPGQDSTSSDVA